MVRVHYVKKMVVGLGCEWKLRSQVNGIPIRYWDKYRKLFLVPLYSKANLKALSQHIKLGMYITSPKALKMLKKAVKWHKRNDRAYKRKSLEGFEGADIPIVNRFGIELYPKQKRMYEIASNVSGFPLFMEAGTGKTLTSLAIIGFHYLFKKARKIVIIYHNPNIDEWLDEMKENFWLDELSIIVKGEKIKTSKLSQSLTIEMLNYELVAKNLDNLIEWEPDVVIVDEFHKIKNVSANRTWDIIKLGDFTPHKYGLTGTEIDGKYVDYFAEYRFLNPDILSPSYEEFLARFCVTGRHRNIVSYKNVELLKAIVNRYSYFVYLSDMEDMPEKHVVEVPIDNANKKWYDRMKKSRVIKTENFRARASYTISKRRKCLEITSGFLVADYDYENDKEVVKRFKRNPKLDELQKRLANRKDKVIVYCNRLVEVKMVAKMCEGKGWSYQLLTGDVKDVKKAKMRFKNEVDILIAMVQKAGTGLNLQFCNHAIYYSLPESWAEWDQSMKRIYRKKQKRDCLFEILLIKDSEDYIVYEALKQKKNYVDYIREGH